MDQPVKRDNDRKSNIRKILVLQKPSNSIKSDGPEKVATSGESQ